MTRILLRLIIPVLLCVLGLTQAQADPEKRIRVELELGDAYAVALGAEASARAKQLAEAALVETLGAKVKYFSFVPSSESGTHTLTFRIDHPTPDLNSSGISLFDYYVFLEFKKDNSDIQHTLHWLFRDAASNLNGVDTPETIAENLRNDIRSQHAHSIIRDMLSKVSFTEKAHFKSQGAKGWIIDHSRQSMCMAPDSEVIVASIVPSEGFEEKYGAEVKRRQSGDDISTFTKATDDVDELMDAPENAKVVAVYVINYQAECENPLMESSPEMVSFDEGGTQ
jgi:hypothetical protein